MGTQEAPTQLDHDFDLEAQCLGRKGPLKPSRAAFRFPTVH
jgi:hypothetical protein